MAKTTDKNNPWKPIDTAPRDGTLIDLFHKDGFRLVDQWWDQYDNCWSCGYDEEIIAWANIPPQPGREYYSEVKEDD